MIDATPGSPDANSYVTLEEAEAYFATRYGSEAWEALGSDEDKKEAVLITGAARNDMERYSGEKTDPDQAMQFPRDGDEDIPRRVKDAQMEAALALLQGGLSLEDTGLEGFKRARVGPMEVETRDTYRAGDLPATVRRLLRDWLVDDGVNVRLVQA